MDTHEESKAWLKKNTEETHARINEDVQKLKNRPEYEMLPTMVKCYVDILILNIELLQNRELNAHAHIDRLDELLDARKTSL